MERLKFRSDDHLVYAAGSGKFSGKNFTRDVLNSALILHVAGRIDEVLLLLESQLPFCALKQALTYDPVTGGEPGKVHHELPPAEDYAGEKLHSGEEQSKARGSTLYNACDTTLLYVMCEYLYWQLTGSRKFIQSHAHQLYLALNYIQRHVQYPGYENLFVESPIFCGAERFALHRTTWEDSPVPVREDGEPRYPIVYPHIQAMAIPALRALGAIFDRNDLPRLANKMKEQLFSKLWDHENGCFFIAIDRGGGIQGKNLASLYALFYLEPDDVPIEYASSITEASRVLETEIGYRGLDPSVYIRDIAEGDTAHAEYVWPWIQAFTHHVGVKFNLPKPREISLRIIPHIQETAPEILVATGSGVIQDIGYNEIQLWTLAAREYFEKT